MRSIDHGRLAGTGYMSLLPVDQGIEHSAGASFAPNPLYFDPENIVKLAIEGGCNGVASTVGVLGAVARRYAHRIPFIVKLNHNELLTYPNEFDQIEFASVERAFELGAAGVGATIYFGSSGSHRQIVEIAQAFERAHELGMITVLWCYLRNPAFKVDGVDYHVAADLTGQANHLGVTIEADIIKQKAPENNGGYLALNKDGVVLRQDEQARLRRADDRPSDRPHPLPGGQLLHGPRGPHQLGRRLLRRDRPRRGGEDRGREQARRRHGPDLGPQGVPAADGRGRRAAERDPGRLPLARGHDRLMRVVATAAALAAAALATGCAASGAGRGAGGDTAADETVRVERVVDGDTIVVAGGERVRYIGVDAPESVKPNSPVECFGPQASAENRRLLEGRTVRLVSDVEPADDYGRRLAYVFREPDGLFVNEALIRDGFAERFVRTPNQRYVGALQRAEARARAAGAGLWSACPSR